METKVVLFVAAALVWSYVELAIIAGAQEWTDQDDETCLNNLSHACAILVPSGPRQQCVDRFLSCVFTSANTSSTAQQMEGGNQMMADSRRGPSWRNSGVYHNATACERVTAGQNTSRRWRLLLRKVFKCTLEVGIDYATVSRCVSADANSYWTRLLAKDIYTVPCLIFDLGRSGSDQFGEVLCFGLKITNPSTCSGGLVTGLPVGFNHVLLAATALMANHPL